MKALRYTAYGVRPVLHDIPVPEPGPGEVLVRVAGAALNPLDVKIGTGSMRDFFPVTLPSVVGTDLAGTVERTGPRVTGWSAGDAVIARTDPTVGGAVAEYALVPATALAAAPVTVPLDRAACLATAAGTAWQAVVETAEVKPGQTVLVHGGAGAVGGFAVQFARRAGARVVTTVSPAGAEIAARLGAHQVIDYTTTDFRPEVSGADVVIDPVGGDTEAASLAVLRPSGLLIGVNVPPDAERAAERGVRAEFLFHRSDAGRLAKVVAEADAGLEIVIGRTVPLAEAAEAFDHLATGQVKGKVVVRP
ncbi:NADP-dependent oxidoreductase [Streptantibioticus cattleyicolor]|uniref:Alcohol dehydrogenase zinc-binding domain protein n=1 Tax=Streptantibioticus cattleyicolor (strain ATCC 35852 / DSM 46488 / JCM 4925 / NBRC 14057 / NRRL 8057) TaxID=1003195 RepID=F8JLF5_STREN|nr:NADP-dependent oxidoreductase [Streptantibioticus cattleyicolor]AEW98330.1 Alcohol dehydrogenase zinc-binding domain protein [Streptantibioticus cattleyicolor NRRL 8057 = DSM 46488]CCB72611.1 putative zinc-binding oxidoreductase [Streptantibioticus cattleyicolor NRRL 8057 = DSM 46488]